MIEDKYKLDIGATPSAMNGGPTTPSRQPCEWCSAMSHDLVRTNGEELCIDCARSSTDDADEVEGWE